MARVGLRENPLTPVKDLGIGKQQLVEIAKALSKDVKLLILDEPTAALNDDDSDPPARPAQGPAGQGHHLDHDQPQAQRDRAGRRRDHDHPRRPHHRDPRRRAPATSTRTGSSAAWSAATSSTASPTTRRTIGEVLFELRELDGHAPAGPPPRGRSSDANLTVRRGEIVGIAGLMGAGRTELARSVFGRVLRQPARGHSCSWTASELALRSGPRRHPGRHRLRQRGPQGPRAEPARRRQDVDHLGRAATSCARGLDRRRARGGRRRRALPHAASTSRPPASRPASASCRAATSRRSSSASGCTPSRSC